MTWPAVGMRHLISESIARGGRGDPDGSSKPIPRLKNSRSFIGVSLLSDSRDATGSDLAGVYVPGTGERLGAIYGTIGCQTKKPARTGSSLAVSVGVRPREGHDKEGVVGVSDNLPPKITSFRKATMCRDFFEVGGLGGESA